jgi:hypothetical protein
VPGVIDVLPNNSRADKTSTAGYDNLHS